MTLSALSGLGPRSQAMLARAGITDLETLQALGSVEAYRRARATNTGVSLNLLWGLEAALTGLPWQQVAKTHRTSLLLALDAADRAAETHAKRG